MAERPISQQTLREQFTHAEQLTKELLEHLEQNLLKRIHDLKKLVQSDLKGEEVIEDVTVRNQAASVLESLHFTGEVSEQLSAYVRSIQQAVAKILVPT